MTDYPIMEVAVWVVIIAFTVVLHVLPFCLVALLVM